ncbi:TfoX/Sxy family protein [Endozoicomonas sp.]|nr:TfoX/Sxy family protein [Endozoicomonas sp.]
MSNELIELKNLGKTSVQWLNAVGIRTPDQLRTTGSVATFCKVRDRGFKVSKVLLYALEGALTDAHWNELTLDQKNSLLQAVQDLSNMNKF